MLARPSTSGSGIRAPQLEGDGSGDLTLNLRGVFIATHAALRHIRDGGRIISIGSCVGERMMTPGLVAYSATKAAIRMFTQGLSRELGHRGITVNNVQPGPIDTDLNPAAGDWATPQIRRHCAGSVSGKVEEIAAMVAFVLPVRRPRSNHRHQPDRRRRHQRLTLDGENR